MQALFSRAAGVLLFPREDSDSPIVSHVGDDVSWGDVERTHLLSTVFDWEEIEATDTQSLVENAASIYWPERAASMLRCLLAGVSSDLESEVLEYVEELLQTHSPPPRVLSMLLIAPLKVPESAAQLANRALAANLSASGALLDSVRDLQPLLSRLVDYWLGLPETDFGELGRSRQDVWRSLAEEGALVRLLETRTRKAFKVEWNKQAFKEALPASRSAIVHIGAELAEKLLPGAAPVSYDALAAYEADFLEEEQSSGGDVSRLTGRETFESVIKQVNSIATLVSQGKDRSAKRFLKQLVDSQERRGDQKYAVKTLCNIAQQCAEMFRADFERICLERALSLAPGDPWSLVQWGNHLKRVGDFDGALEALEKACVGDDERVALASMADVWAERGDYERAISVYKSYAHWEDAVEICTGISDVHRYQGFFEEALQGYEVILRRWPGTDRAIAGKAEIAKRKGELEEALSLYDSLLARNDIAARARLIYYAAKCTILKQANQLEEAFQLADELVQKAPFFMSARVNRGAILGLLGREVEGLRDVPIRTAPAAFRDWFQDYVRGLLLLKLKRYSDARQQLVHKMEKALVTGDEMAVTRLGAAYTFLCEELYSDAERTLESVGQIHDCYTRYLYLVLKFHVAMVKSQNERIQAISQELSEVCESDEDVAKVVDALGHRDFTAAQIYELDLLLRIAA